MRTVLQLQTLVLAAGIILTAAACSRQRSRALEEPRVPEEEGRNYQEMLDRVRNRQSPVQIQESLIDATRRFQREMGRLPTNLTELVRRKYLPELKPAPEGYAYTYDPVHGNVGLAPVTPDGFYRAPEAMTNQTKLNMEQPSLPPPPAD